MLGLLGVGALLVFKIISAPKSDNSSPGAIFETTKAVSDYLWNPAGVDKALSETPIIGWTYGIVPKTLNSLGDIISDRITPTYTGGVIMGAGYPGGGAGAR